MSWTGGAVIQARGSGLSGRVLGYGFLPITGPDSEVTWVNEAL